MCKVELREHLESPHSPAPLPQVEGEKNASLAGGTAFQIRSKLDFAHLNSEFPAQGK